MIDGVGGDTGVKSQHQLRHLPTGTIPHHRFFFFFYSNTNHLVQLEDLQLKLNAAAQCSALKDSRASQIRFILSPEESESS